MRTIYRQQSAQGNAENTDGADTEPVMREFHKEPLDAVIAIAPHCMDHPPRCLTAMLEDELGLGAE